MLSEKMVPQEEVPMEGEGQEMSPETQGQPQLPKLSPQAEKEVDAYLTGLSRLLHSKDTSKKVVEMLKSGPLEQSVPQTALLINQQMEGAATKGGKAPSLDVLFNSAIFLVNDLVEIAQAAGLAPPEGVPQDQVKTMLEGTMQTYIPKGQKDGTIDPVELQQKVEAIMPEDMKQEMMGMSQQAGIPSAPNQMTAMQAYGAQQRRAGMLKGGGKR